MKRITLLLAALLLAATPAITDAGNHKSKSGNAKFKGGNRAAGIGDCPPGLAKKDTGCLPPGQARKYRRGDYIDGHYTLIDRPERYGLKRGETYYRVGDSVYRVNKDTREVLDLVGAVGAVLN